MIMTILFWSIIIAACLYLAYQQWQVYRRWQWAKRIEKRMRRYARSRQPF